MAELDPLVNIGEGRGYANYSWKVVARYDKPVSPDVPTKVPYSCNNPCGEPPAAAVS